MIYKAPRNKRILSVALLLLATVICLSGCITTYPDEGEEGHESYATVSKPNENSSAPVISQDVSDEQSVEAGVTSDEPSDEPSGDVSEATSSEPQESNPGEQSEVPSGLIDANGNEIPVADLISDPEGTVPKNAPVDASYFDDAVFIGDSISQMLSYYEARYDELGKAQFLCAQSLGAGSSLHNRLNPVYGGEQRRLCESVPMTGAKKVYVMLGVNDLGSYNYYYCMKNFEDLMLEILEAAPDVKIYVQSMTPISVNGSTYLTHTDIYNAQTIKRYNDGLAELCREHGWYYLNVASAYADEYGYLPDECVSDPGPKGMGIHFTYDACKRWIEYLFTHAPQD